MAPDQPFLLNEMFREGFSANAIKIALNMCAISYLGREMAVQRLSSMGWSVHPISCAEVDVFVCNSGGPWSISAVVIRGSERELMDWLRNARAYKMNVRGTQARAHTGYMQGWQGIKRLVLNAINGERIFVTGHSAGGGLARAAVLDSLIGGTAMGKTFAGVDFASPPIFNRLARRMFDAYMGSRYWRVVNQIDLVPRLPLGAVHCGKLLYLSGDRIYYPPHTPGLLLLDQLKARFCSPELGESITDHYITDYAKAIKATLGLEGTDLPQWEAYLRD